MSRFNDCCEIVHINGIKTHEIGCIETWKDYDKTCWQCGFSFKASERYQAICKDCLEEESD